MSIRHFFNKSSGTFFLKSGISDRYINYLWNKRVDLENEWMNDETITRIGLLEKGYPAEDIKSDKDLFPSHFPFETLKNTGAPDYQFRDKFVYEIANARLAGPCALGMTKNGRVIRDMISFSGGRFKTFLKNSFRLDFSAMMGSLIPLGNFFSKKGDCHFESICVLHSCWENYFHWITEHLPKLKAVQYYQENENPDIKVIIPPEPSNYIYETLECFGISKEDTLEWNIRAADIDKLVVPIFPEITTCTADWLKSSILNGLKYSPNKKKKNRIYISRKDATVRRVVNEEDLIDFLAEYGFEPFELSKLSFKEQVILFADAEVVIAPHGAGLTNILWSHEIKVLEMFAEKLSFQYARLADACNHFYDAMIVKPYGSEKKDMFVPLSDLRQAFERMGIKKFDE